MFGVSVPELTGNVWNDGAQNPRGNYWSDYTGMDNDTDGVGDTSVPWPCPNGGSPCSYAMPPGVDWYPLMSSWKASAITVQATIRPIVGCPGPQGLNVNLTATAKGGISPYTFNWNFGDGTTGTAQNITHYYTTGGTFFPKVVAVDNTLSANGTDLGAITVFSGGLQLLVSDRNAKPISNANITSLTTPPGQPGFNLISDSQGRGKVACLTPGAYKVQVSHANYIPTIAQFTVANVTINPTVTLASVSSPPGTFPLSWGLYGPVAIAITAGLVTFHAYRQKRQQVKGRASFYS